MKQMPGEWILGYLAENVGRDSVVGIVSRYALDGPGIESREGGARFSGLVKTGPGAHTVSYTMGTVTLSRG